MKRNQQIDFFKGLLLILITVDHFMDSDNLLKKFTFEFVGPVSAAEGFVFLSGLTVGLIYTSKLNKSGLASIAAATRKKAWHIYRYHLLLFLLTWVFLISGQAIFKYWEGEYAAILQNPIEMLFMGSFLLYQPSLLDILPMYVLFMLLTPYLILLYKKQYQWQVLALSFLVYLAGTSGVLVSLTGSFLSKTFLLSGYFNMLCWQFLFVAGLYIGYLVYHQKTRAILESKALLYLSLLICIPLFFINFFYISFEGFDVEFWTERGHLRPLRLLNFAALVAIVAHLATSFKSWFQTKAVCYLGRHSLQVFSLHILLVLLFKPLIVNLNSLYFIQITNNFYIYPAGTAIVLLVMVPTLYMAPFLTAYRKSNSQVKQNI
ncbi:OpgC domain-containing protein [Pontibacter sp. 13R65]|uniref:OpgC domain-containing protein n=1 Tax=Pontibacter sp. 13R65 TaxID=3127458 RepID=UPI00301C6144